MKFLLIEDNQSLAHAICTRMQQDGHVIDNASTIQDAVHFSSHGDYDLILLDIMLPDGDGRDFLKAHRDQNKDTPIIALTARSQVSDRISILDLGADDYMTKPFDHAELEARCRAVLRRQGGASRTVKQFGNVAFNPVAGTLETATNTIQLRNRELRLLEVLLGAPGQIFSKQTLVDRLFSYDDDISENAVEVYIARLRKHLKDTSLQITTLRGLGYRLDNDEA